MAGGYSREFLSINRQLPSPMICVCEGDTIVVDVYVGLLASSDSATIHWHGMWQQNTPHMDGTPYVSQCPIPPEQSFTYEFEAFPPGTYWYHSHLGIQRFDGMAGPLIVMPRSYRELGQVVVIDNPEEFTVFVQDWLNEDAGQHQDMDMQFGFGKEERHDRPETLLINGKGYVNGRRFKNFNNKGNPLHTPPAIFKVKNSSSLYRFRYIQATSTVCPTLVFIPGISLTIIASDGMPIQPIKVDVLSVITGERYDFVVDLQDAVGHIPIFVVYASNFSIFQVGFIVIEKDSGSESPIDYQSLPNVTKLQEQLCCSLKKAKTLLNPIENINGIRQSDFLELVKNCPAESCSSSSQDVDIQSVKLNELRSEKPSAFTRNGGYPSILAQNFSAEENHTVNHTIELSTLGKTGTGPLDLYRFQLNEISYRSPPHPGLFYENSKDTWCNKSTITKKSTIMTADFEDKFYWCPHNLDLPPNKTVEIALISKENAWVAHPLHMHGHSYAVVAMAYNVSQNMSLEYFQQLDRKGEVKRNLIDPIRKDTVLVPCEYFWLNKCNFISHLVGQSVNSSVVNNVSSILL